jgi:CAAX prenyl protease-like protein
MTEPASRRTLVTGEVAYVLPMALFLALTWLGGTSTALYPASYAAKTLVVAAVLVVLRGHYTPIRWNAWGLGVVVGVVGVVQWIGTERLLLSLWPDYPRFAADIYDPTVHIADAQLRWLFIAVRLSGAVLVVPFMEELFWRDWLWRTIAAPNDFRLAAVGEWDARAFLVVPLLFATVHVQWFTAIIWALMIGLLLVRTRSLGACIIAHAVTNLLLGLYVLWTGEWYYW